MRAFRWAYLLGAVCLIGTNGFALLIPWVLKLSVESLSDPGGGGRSPGFYAALVIGAALLFGVIRIFSRTTLLHAARRIEYRIREDLYAALLRLDQPYFNRFRTGDITSRFANDLTNVRMLVGFGVLNIFNTITIYLATLTLMCRISFVLTVCSVIPFILMVLIIKKMSGRMFSLVMRTQAELGRISSQVEENVAAATVVRAYCREESQIGAFHRISRTYLESNLQMARIRGMMLPVMGASSGLGTLIVLFLGGSMVISGGMGLGDFVAFSAYLSMLVWPTVTIGWIMNLAQRGAASMARLSDVLDAVPLVAEAEEPAPVTALRGDIELRNLSFSYNGEAEGGEAEERQQYGQLQDISLAIPKGTRLGIVGPVGSGKSTLVKLMARLYPVREGALLMDGIDCNRIPLAVLRSAIGYVTQESFLFSRTIGENIAFGKPGATGEEIEAAARLASLEADIRRFSDGYETLVGERGITLSGGQKQRTAIARALLKNPAILILDDPLSAVDARTEEEILAGLTGYFGDRTVIMVSHRLSALRECERIIVLEEGRMVEHGSHDELLALNGSYAAMYREQQLRREIETF